MIVGLPPRDGAFVVRDVERRSWLESVGAMGEDPISNRVNAAFAIGSMLQKFRMPRDFEERPIILPPDDNEVLETISKVKRSAWATKSQKKPTQLEFHIADVFGSWRAHTWYLEVRAAGRLRTLCWAYDLMDGIDGVELDEMRQRVAAFVLVEYKLTIPPMPSGYPWAGKMLHHVEQRELLSVALRNERRAGH